MRDDDAAAVGDPKTPEYRTPTGAEARLPLYGSSDSVVPLESKVTDFDPKAERRKKAQAARAAAAARTERARRVAREEKAAAAAGANRLKREAALARTKDAHAAAAASSCRAAIRCPAGVACVTAARPASKVRADRCFAPIG